MSLVMERKTTGWQSILRALSHRNFRLFFAGQSISLIGTWMQQIAMSWLVYRITGSGLLLGGVNFSAQIPSFFLAPLAGVMADRWNRHRMLVVTQTLAMVQAFLMAFVALSGSTDVGPIILLSIFLGLVNAFDMTGRQAFMTEMLDRKEDLANAIALNSSMVNGARLIGPSLAGILIAVAGEGVCFLLNGVSYIAVIIALLAMHVAPRLMPVSRHNLWEELHEGFAYTFGSPPIRSVLLLLALVSLVGMPYAVLMPIFTERVLHGGASELGFLMAASGVGALTGAIYLAARKSILGLGKRIALAPAAFGVGLILLACTRDLWLALLVLWLVGFAMMVQMAASNTILQTISDEDKRGRVMSFYMMAFMGMAPVGSLTAGALADRIGTPTTLLFGGFCCIGGALLFARTLPRIREIIRPIYRRIGILPELAVGIQQATEMTVPPED
jgi:MFS family permease